MLFLLTLIFSDLVEGFPNYLIVNLILILLIDLHAFPVLFLIFLLSPHENNQHDENYLH